MASAAALPRQSTLLAISFFRGIFKRAPPGPAPPPLTVLFDSIMRAYLTKLWVAQAGFVSDATPTDDVLAGARDGVFKFFYQTLRERVASDPPDAWTLCNSDFSRALDLPVRRDPDPINRLFAGWSHRRLRVEMQRVFLDPTSAQQRPLLFSDTLGQIAAALQECVLSTPGNLRMIDRVRPIGPAVQPQLSKVLETLEKVRQQQRLPRVRPLATALMDLQTEVAEADGFVFLALKPPVTAPLQSETDLELYAREDARAIDLARQIVRSSGVVLVAGYRGVGKSSFVNQALKKHVPDLATLQSTGTRDLITHVQVNLAKSSGIESVLRLCIRATYRALIQDASIEQWLRPEERERMTWAYLRASYKVDSKDTTSIETVKHIEASMEVKLASLVTSILTPGPIGLLVGWIPKLGPALSAKWTRDSKDKLERTVALLDYDEDRAEEDLQVLIKMLTLERPTAIGPARIKLAFVFDEMDKMDEKQQEELLKRCKNLFLSRDAVFLLVTSKRFYYGWLKERGVEDSMLGSYFSSVAVVPLFTSADAKRLIEHMEVPQAGGSSGSDGSSTSRQTLLSDLALCLTYRSGGLPREIVRKLDEFQDWLSDDLQPVVSTRSTRMSSMKCYADIQRVLEGMPKTLGTLSSTSSDDPSPRLGSGFLWNDEVRTEQVMHGLYVLMEELISARSLELLRDVDWHLPPGSDAAPQKLHPLAQLYVDNFTLVSPTDFSSLMETLAVRLQSLKTPDGTVSLFERRSPLPDHADRVTSVLWVSDALYALTGRTPAGSSDQAPTVPASPDPLADLVSLLNPAVAFAGHTRLLDLRALVLLKQITVETARPQAGKAPTTVLLELLRGYVHPGSTNLQQERRVDWTSVIAGMFEALERVHTGNILEQVVDCLDPRLEFAEAWLEPLFGLSGDAPGGALDLVALLAERQFIEIMEVAARQALARERLSDRLLALWQRILPRRNEPAAAELLIQVLTRLPQGVDQPTEMLLPGWLAGPGWNEADARLLLEAVRRERLLGPYLLAHTQVEGEPEAAERARQRLASLGLSEPTSRATRERQSKMSSSATDKQPDTPRRPFGLVQRVLLVVWLLAMAVAYVAIPADLPEGADLGQRLTSRGLVLLFWGAAWIALSLLVTLGEVWMRWMAAVLIAIAGACAAVALLILHLPLTLSGEAQLLAIIVLAAVVTVYLWTSDRLRGAAPGAPPEPITQP